MRTCVGKMPFEHPWPWHVILISILIVIVVLLFFGMISEKSQDHKSYDHLSYQIAIMQENHLQEMQDMHRQHQKEMQDMHERQLVIQKQTDLINMFNQIMHEIQRLTDQYVAGIREYSHLKDIDNSYIFWLVKWRGTSSYVSLRKFVGNR